MTVAGQGQVSVDTLLGKQPRRPSKWNALLAWRDWRLPVKLAAICFVPIVLTVVLGSIAVAGQVQEVARTQRAERLVSLSTRIHTLIGYLQQERAVTTGLLGAGASGRSQELDRARGAVDRAVDGFVSGVRSLEPGADSGIAEQAEQAVRALSSTLPQVRDGVDAGQVDTATAVSKYSAVIATLLDLDTSLVAAVDSTEVGRSFRALHTLVVAREMLSVQRSLIGHGFERSALLPSTLDRLRTIETRFTQRLGDFRVIATGARTRKFGELASQEARETREHLVTAVLNGDGSLTGVSEQRWRSASAAVSAGIEQLATDLRKRITATVDEQSGSATGGLVALVICLVLAVALAVFIGVVISRQLLGSLRQLRSSAMDVAHDQLPAVVHSVQQGDRASTEVAAMPVRGSDEVGALARAFDEVHGQAVRLAADQATMRTAYGNVFVNLSRRSQSLVQRQLQLIERLERDEEDADQLATLFQLDHLATRMRRNNENLLVLSGGESGRRAGGPVSVTDVLRAAVSEIEQYQRVDVKPAPDARVVGHAASDLMRLIAELLDNATAFSAPETEVTLTPRFEEDGSLSIDVTDRGIGMSATEVAEANTRMVEAASAELATARRMGLFVVGRLAGKHGLRVTLHGGGELAGVRANVLIPAGLLAGVSAMTSAPPAGVPACSEEPAESSAVPPANTNGSALPRRTRGANGSPHARRPGAGDVGPWPTEEPPADDKEVSGTALFTPIGSDQPSPWPRGSMSAEDGSGDGAGRGVPADTVPAGSGTAPAAVGEVEEDAAGADTAEDGGGSGDDLPKGSELFAANVPLAQWWSAAERAHDEAEQTGSDSNGNSATETTPIFNEMASAWFRAASPTKEQSADSPVERSGRWDFAADENRRTVESVGRTEPAGYTAAGLPRRRRGAKLLPGSAGSSTDGDSARPLVDGTGTTGSSAARQFPVRAPEDVRGRLSSFQRGLHQGKQERQDAGTAADVSGGDGSAPNATPSARSGDDGAEPEPSRNFGPDASPPEVKSVAGSAPSDYTAAGLPRRRRGEQLLPGSVGGGDSVPGARTERDPDSVRGRLSSFQQGVRRGRHQTTQTRDGNSEQMENE